VAKISAVNERIYIDHHALSTSLSTAQTSVDRELPVVTGFSDVGPRRVLGNYDHGIDANGFFDGAASGIDGVIDALRSGGPTQVCHQFGVALGDLVYEHRGEVSNQPRSSRNGEAVMLNFGLVGAAAMFRGNLLTTDQDTATAAVNGTGVNVGASTATQIIVAVIRVISMTASNINITIQDSPNNSTWANTGLQKLAITAAGIHYLTSTEATDIWKRYELSNFTGGGNAVIHISHGILAT
jgi:hypothetical protein